MTHYEQIFSTCDSIHRTLANRASHAIGVPLIVTAILAAKSYLRVPGDGMWHHAIAATLMAALTVAVVLPWLWLAGLAHVTLIATCHAAASATSAALGGWTASDVITATFLLGWVFQFIGHGFESKSPQLVKRPENLLLGPVLIMAELVPAVRPAALRCTGERA
ncbi:MAG: Mpo1-like protein [Brevundimonas sp.]|jgi:uncharacterized membrane protein YGL010W|uniref:Mpo1-like protein n=1 Tax=Brevundimonas sp. TaxID=1871086 RepID=UPI0022C10D95|nr:DUF962 domain-containing protein [Brevundimonas sp.]